MHDVSWLLYLPPTLERLSGYAAAGRRRGFFVLEELGVVHLLLDAEEPPFLLVRANVPSYGEQQLLLRLEDEEATRALLAQLELELAASTRPDAIGRVVAPGHAVELDGA